MRHHALPRALAAALSLSCVATSLGDSIAGTRTPLTARTLMPEQRAADDARAAAPEPLTPHRETPRGIDAPAQSLPQPHPTNPAEANPFASRDAAPCGPLLQSPSLFETFEHLNDTVGSTPPNPVASVGPNHVVGMANRRVRMKTRAGGLLINTGLNTFMGSPSSVFSDPQTIYNRSLDRFLAVATADPNSPASRLVVALSASANPAAAWHLLTLDADPSNALSASDARIGGNDDLVIVTANMHAISGGAFVGVQMWVIDATSFLDGGDVVSWQFAPGFDTQPAGALFANLRGFSMVPAEVVGPPASPLERIFLVDNTWASSPAAGSARLSHVRRSGANVLWERSTATTPNAEFIAWPSSMRPGSMPREGTFNVLQPESSTMLRVGDTRIRDVVQRGGVVTFAWHAIEIDNGVAIGWTSAFPGPDSNAIVGSGVIAEGINNACASPNIAINCAGDIAFSFVRGGLERFAEAGWLVRRANGQSTGPQTLKAGVAPFARGSTGTSAQWSTTSGAVVDPANDTSFWVAGSFAAQPEGQGNNATRWGTWWGRVGTSSGEGCQPVWSRVEPVRGPTGRFAHAMAYDGARGRTLLFGGITATGTPQSDLWSWDGSSWRLLLRDAGPPARFAHRMVSDPQTGDIYLFGGAPANPTAGNASLGDLWKFDGSRWTLLSTVPDLARREHAMAFDSARRAIVIHGGRDRSDVVRGDTWVYSLATAQWTGAVGGPSARTASAMAFDAARGRAVLVGGLSNFVALSDTWEWTGNAWLQPAPSTPAPPTHLTTLAYDATAQRVVMYAGKGQETIRASRWEYDGVTWREYLNLAPIDRKDHAFAYDAARNVFVIHAGEGPLGGTLDDTWEMSVQSDRSRATSKPKGGSGPAGRADGTLTWDPTNEALVLWGGFRFDELESLRETWIFGGEAWGRASTHGTQPPLGRSATAMAHVPGDSTAGTPSGLLLYGGVTPANVALDDRWLLDSAGRWSRINEALPPGLGARLGHAMTGTNSASVGALLCGGRDAASTQSSAWTTKDGRTWTRIDDMRADSFGTLLRVWAHKAAFDPTRNRVQIFDGRLNNGTDASLTGIAFDLASQQWTYTGSSHASRTVPGGGAVAFDARLGEVLFLTPDNGTMSYGAFSALPSAASLPAPPRSAMMLARDETSDQLIMFGGWRAAGGVHDDTQRFLGQNVAAFTPPQIPTVASTYTPCLGVTRTLTATLPAGATRVRWVRCTDSQNCQPLDPSRFLGINTPTLTVTNIQAEDVTTSEFSGTFFAAIAESDCAQSGVSSFSSGRIVLTRPWTGVCDLPLSVFFSASGIGFGSATSNGFTQQGNFSYIATRTTLQGGGSTGSGFASASVGVNCSIIELPRGFQIIRRGQASAFAGGPNSSASITIFDPSFIIDSPAWVTYSSIPGPAVPIAPGRYSLGMPGVGTGAGGTSGWSYDDTITIMLDPPTCDPIDFNQNALFPEDEDLIDFLSVLAGGPCSPGNSCNDIDFNNDGLFPADDDLVAFLRVLAGGDC